MSSRRLLVLPVAASLVFVPGRSSEPAESVPVVSVIAPDPLLVPRDDLPRDVRLVEFVVPDANAPSTPADLLDESRGAQTLYRDDDGERQLVVARSESSDTGGGFAPVGIGEPVQLADGREATLLQSGTLTIVGWDESDADDCDVCYQTGVVAARGLTPDEVLAVATGAAVRELIPTAAADTVPDGITAVSVAPLLDPFEDLRSVPAQLILADPDGNEGLVFVYGDDDALAEHLSFWVEDGIHAGAAFGAAAFVRQVDDAVVIAVSLGIAPATMDEFVDALRPGDADTVEELLEDLQNEPVTTDDSCLTVDTDPDRTAVLGGTTEDGARWVAGFGLAADDGDLALCYSLSLDGEQVSATSSIGGRFTPPLDPSEIDIGVARTAADGRGWWTVRGPVASAAASVFVTLADTDQPIEAQLSDVGPADGWLWFAVTVPATTEGRPAVSAIAFDAAGDEVAVGATN